MAQYDVGDGRQELVEDRRVFNDGQYHYVTFIRRGSNATMTVDDYPKIMVTHKGTVNRSTKKNSVQYSEEMDWMWHMLHHNPVDLIY